MLKVIEHITKAIILVVVSVVCFSCGFDFKSVNGNGNVTTQTRTVANSFDTVLIDGNIDVVIEQGMQQSVLVEADENLQEHIKTEVVGNELKIAANANISDASQKKITVVLPAIKNITVTKAASVITKGSIKGQDLTLNVSAGAHLKANVQTRNVKLETSSGGFIEVVGSTQNIEANASSGSTLDAQNLKTPTAKAHASSGGTVTVNPLAKLSAEASSGGEIYYITAPPVFDKKIKNGGNISKK